jgi:hypothetical protein
VRFPKTVFLGAVIAGCAKPDPVPVNVPVPAPTSHTTSSASPPPSSSAPSSPAPSSAPSSTASAPTRPATSPTGSAYFGCDEPIPVARLWDETTEAQVFEAITQAKACAAENGKHLLLEFVAPWCDDCREMAKLDETPVVSEALRKRFERVRVNVGKWDRHEGLRENFHVKALATYVVIEPKTSKVLAQTTLEPITKKRGKKLTAEDWAAWLSEK